MKPIFNEKVAEKCNLWIREQCTGALFTDKKSASAAGKKKKAETCKHDVETWIQTAPKS